MGLFWDLMQQSQLRTQDSQLRDQERQAMGQAARITYLENELRRTQKTLHNLIGLLEEKFGQDIDGDGKIG